jgi:cytochrome oxidase Cu insertion factor (SCO1/SenC/PrrC family)
VAFFGSDLENIKGNTFNLDKKILEKYYDFNDFQFVLILPHEAKEETSEFIEEFKKISESSKWKIAYGDPENIQEIFNSFKTPHKLDENSHSPYVFIVDKEGNLRGRDDDGDHGKIYGYDSRDVAELNNKMNDDVKVILAEYRLALKKNKANRKI